MKKFYFVLLVFLLPSCRQISLKKNNLELLNEEKIAYIKVKGIECEFCAQSALKALSKIDGVIQAQFEKNNFIHINKYFENKRIELIYLPDKVIDQDIISQALSIEGFQLDSIS